MEGKQSHECMHACMLVHPKSRCWKHHEGVTWLQHLREIPRMHAGWLIRKCRGWKHRGGGGGRRPLTRRDDKNEITLLLCLFACSSLLFPLSSLSCFHLLSIFAPSAIFSSFLFPSLYLHSLITFFFSSIFCSILIFFSSPPLLLHLRFYPNSSVFLAHLSSSLLSIFIPSSLCVCVFMSSSALLISSSFYTVIYSERNKEEHKLGNNQAREQKEAKQNFVTPKIKQKETARA